MNEIRTNTERSDTAEDLITSYFSWGENEPEIDLGDIIADIMHYCYQKNLTFHKIVKSAQSHFIEELLDDPLTLAETKEMDGYPKYCPACGCGSFTHEGHTRNSADLEELVHWRCESCFVVWAEVHKFVGIRIIK